ncbi:MAG TPA: 50S ribosomal protein L15 [Nitrospiraceae bacterium]|nr:MAG: 50S ribosomal protein L15 [Nitrospirae bacterium GWA2_46_11]OGW24656.1 MAG: 50S ribosomal protein L15 [Nitrospirae bacterium GWB2_47_37]HAK88089.1 50S ribosomal protein L15 [Nitrospiraceae bacterium]HCL80766.1 50S ribosomal protein L15 [Nitrospiraceae bacterium]HCZ12247.1 50S ribosomal protein L15 [Nitrospiraceae bacterium]
MKIQDLTPAEGSTKRVKRIGRGPASGHGKTATKGHKGQKARSGGPKGPAFEGGQTPLQRRLPKRGFKNIPFKKEYAVLNIKDIAALGVDLITPETLLGKKVIKDIKDGIKILGIGDLSKPVTVKAHAFSASALSKINAAGGKAEVL